MIITSNNGRTDVIQILTDAFDANKSVNYIVRKSGNRRQHIAALMAYAIDVCMLFGEVWLSDDRKACLLYIYPERKKPTLQSVWLDVKLAFDAIGISGIKKALQREKRIAAEQLQGKTIYLWFIGVSARYQNHGIGTKLLKELIDVADIESRTIILETSTIRNLPWYEGFVFERYASLDFNFPLHFFKKEPD